MLGEKGVLIEASSKAAAKLAFRRNTGIRSYQLEKITDQGVSKILGKNIIGKYTTPEIAQALKGQTLATDILLQSSIYKSF